MVFVRMNPVYKKELKTSVRTIRMSLIILGYNLIMVLIGLISFYFTFHQGYYNTADFADILFIYILLAVIEFGLVLFVVPAFTASAISGERERQTLEILLTTKLRPSQIIRGKLLSSISSTLLLIFSSLPIFALVFCAGGIRLWDLLEFLLFGVVTAVFVGSIGIFFSTVFKKTVPATVVTYGSIVVLLAGTMAIVLLANSISANNYETQFYRAGGEGIYSPPGVGPLILLLMLNPAVSLVSLLSGQFGSVSYLKDLLYQYGRLDDFFFSNWYMISIIVQMIFSFLLLFLSSKRLNPLGKTCKRKQNSNKIKYKNSQGI